MYIILAITQSILNNYIVIYIIIFTSIITVIKSLDIMARTNYVRYNFSKDNYRKANSLLEILRQGITFVVGGCSYFILQEKSLNKVFIMGICVFLIALLFSFKIPLVEMPESLANSEKENKTLKRVYKGFQFFKNDHKTSFLFLHTIVPNISVIVLNSLYPKMFQITSGGHAKDFALLSIPYGLGALLAGIHKLNGFIVKIFPKYQNSLTWSYLINTVGFSSALMLPYFFQNTYIIYLMLFIIYYLLFHIYMYSCVLYGYQRL